MAATLGAFSRVFTQKCRILSISVTRPNVLCASQQNVPGTQERRPFSQDIPTKPKRPLTSFLQFTAEQRPKLIAMEPDLSPTDLTKKLGAMWRDMSESEKEVYRLEYESRLERYAEEMEDFKSKLTDEQLDALMELGRKKKEMRAKRKHRSEMRRLNKPKRPPTGYSLFIKAHFNQQTEVARTKSDAQIQFKAAAKAWRALPEVEKQRYNEESSLLMEAYREEMEEWKRRMEEEEDLTT